ncbi:MAG: transketolase [Gammaproteobacteria bacterium]
MPSRRDLANAIRALTLDAVKQANSGHSGMPMGMADIAEVLWNDFLRHNPADPQWLNRDRFILSNGHGSMLQYALLHLTGYDLSLEDIKQFRQLHSKTPGHPEFGETPGVETTTGPLGQGLAHGVGMAIAERILAAQFNIDHFTIVDHFTYVFAGDGCLMEGISHEVCSLAGTLGLGKLIVIYDDNGISIDGKTAPWFSDDTPTRFKAYGWQVIADVDGHNPEAVKQALQQARSELSKPSIICCKTVIGFGAPTQAGHESAHAAITDNNEIAGAKRQLDWNYAPFEIPHVIYQAWDARHKGAQAQQQWQILFDEYQQVYPQLAQELLRRTQLQLPEGFTDKVQTLLADMQAQTKSVATRKASQMCLNVLAPMMPELIGGSADLSGSNCTIWDKSVALTADTLDANYVYYGVREFGMSAIMCGLALHGGFVPYGGTFLVFSDYARNAVRLAALMRQKVVFVYSHDSIGLGEDGPTHQPIEHAAMLRMTPNMSVWRPCDAVETAAAWQTALQRQDGPTSLLLSRQNLPIQPRTPEQLSLIARGGYVLYDAGVATDIAPEIILLATGSEVELAVQAAQRLNHLKIRVVSMPSLDMFQQQSAEYRQQVLPAHITRRIAIEAGSPEPWYRYVGSDGHVLGMEQFGASAPAEVLFTHFGFTVDHVIDLINQVLTR